MNFAYKTFLIVFMKLFATTAGFGALATIDSHKFIRL